jgi:GNAT superfamily N-acetyltransferase
VNDPAAAHLWTLYGRHAAVVLSSGPDVEIVADTHRFIVWSGADHVDLNQSALYGAADSDAVADLARRVLGRGVPMLLSVSSTFVGDPSGALIPAGFELQPTPEVLMWAAPAPLVEPAMFDVRRVVAPIDEDDLVAVFEAVHHYEPGLVSRMYGRALLDRPDVSVWLAKDGSEAVSCVVITRVDDTLGVFDMITVPRHRRRGAGRAILTRAIDGATRQSPDPIRGVVLWATPLGRPLYEVLGFRVIDTIAAWTFGASPEDLADVGAG